MFCFFFLLHVTLICQYMAAYEYSVCNNIVPTGSTVTAVGTRDV